MYALRIWINKRLTHFSDVRVLENTRRVIILFTRESGVEALRKLLNNFRNDSVYILVREDDSKALYREFNKLLKINHKVVVLDDRDAEVKSLKILVDIEPDIIIDCDRVDKLIVFKRLLKSTMLRKLNCYDLIT